MDGKALLKWVRRSMLRETEKKRSILVTVLALIGLIVVVAAVIYAVLRFMTPDEFEGYDDAEYSGD